MKIKIGNVPTEDLQSASFYKHKITNTGHKDICATSRPKDKRCISKVVHKIKTYSKFMLAFLQ